MKHWGLLITGTYAAIVLLFGIPGFAIFMEKSPGFGQILQAYQHWFPWVWAAVLVAGQAALLLVSVDSSWRHAKPRQHLGITVSLVVMFAGVLAFLACWSVIAAVYGDKGPPFVSDDPDHALLAIVGSLFVFWLLWGGVFHRYCRTAHPAFSDIVSWLLKGSVLELLVAVPCHVIVRQREDCSAPIVTGFGIVTGLAIMLLCFGPGVLALYRRRLERYSRHAAMQGEARSL